MDTDAKIIRLTATLQEARQNLLELIEKNSWHDDPLEDPRIVNIDNVLREEGEVEVAAWSFRNEDNPPAYQWGGWMTSERDATIFKRAGYKYRCAYGMKQVHQG